MKCVTLDLRGKKINRLTVLEYVRGGKWLVRCECGVSKQIRGDYIADGRTKSCGCWQRERMTEIGKIYGKMPGIHKSKYSRDDRAQIFNMPANAAASLFGVTPHHIHNLRWKWRKQQEQSA